ncbi:MAG: sensor histidine kinase N-terminal domain-containing protein [Aquabacterium sp.]|jgi:two-component system, OmpR family, sensor histidine kinase TctE|uniref:sensor histidine kinase n=1 Tax=Aquabacterium sp. TaxID=1872578 RepID=UPI003BB2175B
MISLRRRVARWLLPALVGLLLVNAWYGQRAARQSLDRVYDRGLMSSAHLIAERTYSAHGEVVVDLPYAALDVSNERVFYGVFWPDGKVITGYDDLPHVLVTNRDSRVSDAVYRDHAVRLVVLRKPLYDPLQTRAGHVLVAVAETVDGRSEMAHELFLEGLRSQALLVCVGLLLLWVAITRGLRPLTRLGEAFHNRQEDDLTPLSITDIPSEVQPLIDAVNHHMLRIGAMLQARKRFVADAAHQLRTPLAVLLTQIDYGLRQQDPAEGRQALAAAGHSVRHMQRLANQLLSLSSAEAINGLAQSRDLVDMVALARDVSADLSLLAIERKIDLGFEPGLAAMGPLQAWGHEALLRELIVNLVDNALCYTQAGGCVTVAVSASDRPGHVRLTVSDNGPGIPPEERTKVFHRFYRILGRTRTEGSGLGLAIVREIAQAHGAAVALDSGPEGRGLQVSVDLPSTPQGPG